MVAGSGSVPVPATSNRPASLPACPAVEQRLMQLANALATATGQDRIRWTTDQLRPVALPDVLGTARACTAGGSDLGWEIEIAHVDETPAVSLRLSVSTGVGRETLEAVWGAPERNESAQAVALHGVAKAIGDQLISRRLAAIETVAAELDPADRGL